MTYNRRTFIGKLTTTALVASISPSAIAQSLQGTKIKALAFDAFPIFDPRPVFALTEELFPGKGVEISNFWKSKLFEYQWLRLLSDQYKDFWAVAQDALVFASKAAKVELTDEKKIQLMNSFVNLKVWPDVPAALQQLKDAGVKLVFLSNMTEKMLRANMNVNGLDKVFDDVFSTDTIHTYKPAPEAYKIAVHKLNLKKSEIGFVAFAGWDAAGGKSFGYPTYWVNRQGQVPEELGTSSDWVGSNLNELVAFLTN